MKWLSSIKASSSFYIVPRFVVRGRREGILTRSLTKIMKSIYLVTSWWYLQAGENRIVSTLLEKEKLNKIKLLRTFLTTFEGTPWGNWSIPFSAQQNFLWLVQNRLRLCKEDNERSFTRYFPAFFIAILRDELHLLKSACVVGSIPGTFQV